MMLTSWRTMAGASVLTAGLVGAALALLSCGVRAEGPPAKKATDFPAETKPLIDTDFSRGDFAALGWKASGAWDVFTYPKTTANNPGAVARFPANKPDGSLAKTFAEVRNPRRLQLALDYGWGWGDASQPADGVAFMLLDARGNGYVFEVHRCKARWAVQWARVADGTPAKEKIWARPRTSTPRASPSATAAAWAG